MSESWSRSSFAGRRPLLTVAGFPVVVPWTAWAGIALIAAVNAPTFRDAGGTVATVAFAAGLYCTVLVHELAHAVVARVTGHRVLGIELGILGGATAYLPEVHPNPKHELRVAVAGPAASLASGMLLEGIGRGARTMGLDTIGVVLIAIGVMNVFLAALNLLPAAPLDGGHVCEAIVWRLTHSRRTGMRVTAVLGYLIGTFAVWTGLLLATIDGEILVFLGFILMLNAAALWRQSRPRPRPGRSARRFRP